MRKEIDETVKELRSRLTPSSLASEVAVGVGLTDASWGGAFEFASKRHPVPTAFAGLGIALWALVAIRNRSRRGGVASLASPLRELSESLVDSASKCFGNALHSNGGNLFELPKHESLLARRDYPTRSKESWTMLLIRSPAEARSDR